MARVEVRGAERAARSVEAAATKIDNALHRYLASKESAWLEFLRSTIRHVVYDAYEPQKYRRRADVPLIKATKSETRRFLGGSPLSVGTTLRLYNDTSEVQPTRPKGGSPAVAVPWEIEEGTYPAGWLGYAHPRPAYLITADFLRPRILAEADAIVESMLK